MKTRVLAAAVLLPLLLIILLVLPEIFTALLFGAMSAMAVYELLYNTGLINHPRLTIYSMIMAFMVSLWCHFDQNYAWGLLGILAFCGCLFGEMMGSHVKIRFEHLAMCFMAGLIIPFLFEITLHTDEFRLIIRIHEVPAAGFRPACGHC